ncbi:MAG: C25 family cysteine peptidase [Candidatus Cloacimonetes bacterium]|nr:C25 family cysteine peptidase [Candidatus Cloacimonadota bacterium]
MKRLLILLSLLLLLGTAFTMELVQINPFENRSVSINVLESYDDFTIVEVLLNHYQKGSIEIDGVEYLLLSLPSAGARVEQGNPDLPLVARALMIPAQAKMHYEILETSFNEFEGQMAPSKGHFLRSVNPEDIPFTFSEVYQTDAFYPQSIVELNDPFIMREIRGISFRVTPFAVNPVQNVVRVYERVVFKVYADGIDTIDILPAETSRITKDFVGMYTNNFINFNHFRSRSPNFVEEQGSILVICFPAFMDAAQPYVDWKNQKGIRTVMVPSTDAGNTGPAIKTFITNYWNDNPDLAFVQIIGDAPQVPTHQWSSWSSDPTFVNILGSNHYTDLFIGRFSAENVAEVVTQVERSIWYERDIVEGAWLNKAMGLAGNEAGGHLGESDNQHMEKIRQMFLNNGTYSHVDAIYQPNANVNLVSNAINDGRAMINYIAHGSVSGWHFLGGGSMDYYNQHVNALTNDWMLPHIISVACDNGIFAVGPPCFAETWLRATNPATGAPTGAIATFMASMSQWWQPPMWGQDYIAEFHVDEEYKTIGGLYFNGSAAMLNYSNQSQYYETARTWHIFGDASLVVRSQEPIAMEVDASDVFFIGFEEYTVNVDTPGALVSLYNPETKMNLGTAIADINGDAVIILENPMTEPGVILLTITAYNRITVVNEISVIPNDGVYLLFDSYVFTEDNSPDYGTTPALNVAIKNMGTASAENVTLTIQTDDTFIGFVQAQTTIATIYPEDITTVLDAFILDIPIDVPDQHEAMFVMTAFIDDEEWIMNFSVTFNAPNLDYAEAYIVSPGTNDRFDPGDTVDIYFPFVNNGHATSSIGNIIIHSNHPEVTIAENTKIVPAIEPEGISYAIFTVTAGPDIVPGSTVRFAFLAEFSSQNIASSHSFGIGMMIEDFETGDFSAFDWVNVSLSPWYIDSNIKHDGQYSAASGNVSDQQTSALSLTKEITMPGTISFYYKVSSESNGDFLQFYLNNAVLGQWSGEVDWTYVEFNIPAGVHQFRWIYRKNDSGSNGLDKAWIDRITFPFTEGQSINGPLLYVSVEKFDFSEATVQQTEYAEEFRIINFGNQTLNGTIEVPHGFILYNNDGERVQNYSIPQSGFMNFNIVFTPTEEIDYSGNMVIASNDETNPEHLVEIIANLEPVSLGDAIGLSTELIGNFPNPFNPETTIRFNVGKAENIQISIYNIRGQLVKLLVNEEFPAGSHEVIWNGTDTHGRTVSSGVYLYRFNTSETSQINRMLLMK